jgi:hypothetical protein
VESLATGSTRPGWPLDATRRAGSPTIRWPGDAAVDAVADLNADISEDAGWTVFEAWGVNGTGQVTGFGTAVVVGIYHQRGYLLTMQCERC